MFFTLTDVQNGAAVPLLLPIDNRSGERVVGLRSLTYTYGWYNVKREETFSCRAGDGQKRQINVPPGFWSFKDLTSHLKHQITLKASRTNGLVHLAVPEGQEVTFSDGLLDLLGLDDGRGGEWLKPGTYQGDRPVRFASTQTIRLHLEQLGDGNFLNGGPSTLLETIGVSCGGFGDVATVYFPNPQLKPLMAGTVSELKLTVRDDDDSPLDNHGLPITAVLEVR